MKRHIVNAFSVICLVLTACSGSEGSSLQEMPVNTAVPGATVRPDTTAATEMTASSATTVQSTLSTVSQKTTQLQTSAATTASRAASTSTTVLTTSVSTTSFTTTALPVVTTTLPFGTVTTAAATTTIDHAVLIAEAQAEANRLQEEVILAESAVQSAKNALNAAQSASAEATRLYEEFAEAHESELALYNKGSLGFFTQSNSEKALEIAEQIEKLRQENDSFGTSTTYGDPDDATSLEHMKESFALLRKCNALRAEEGLPPLKVTDRLMAIAQYNLNWSYHAQKHSQRFNVGENLAWGYDNPFEGWYDNEKEGHGAHYQSIVNPEYLLTGMAVRTGHSGGYSISHSQVFDYDTGEKAYTVDEYEARFHEYYDSLHQIQTELTEKRKTAADADAAAAAQILAVSQAEQALNAAENAYNQAERYLTELQKQ